MVEGLAVRLSANPDGWVQLLRSRMVLKQGDLAQSDLAAKARKALVTVRAGMAKVDAAAREFVVPGNQ